jgi:hypothetical protein
MLPTYTPYADPMAATVAYDMAVKGPVDKALISPLAAPSPGNSTNVYHLRDIILANQELLNNHVREQLKIFVSPARRPRSSRSPGLAPSTPTPMMAI